MVAFHSSDEMCGLQGVHENNISDCRLVLADSTQATHGTGMLTTSQNGGHHAGILSWDLGLSC